MIFCCFLQFYDEGDDYEDDYEDLDDEEEEEEEDDADSGQEQTSVDDNKQAVNAESDCNLGKSKQKLKCEEDSGNEEL